MTSDRTYQPPLCLLQFLHCQEVLHLCSLLLPLIVTGIPRSCYVSWSTRSCFCVLASFCSPTNPHLPPRPGCSSSMLWWENYSSWVRVKVFTVKQQIVEGEVVTHIHRLYKIYVLTNYFLWYYVCFDTTENVIDNTSFLLNFWSSAYLWLQEGPFSTLK